jgi:MoxR-like ATPase
MIQLSTPAGSRNPDPNLTLTVHVGGPDGLAKSSLVDIIATMIGVTGVRYAVVPDNSSVEAIGRMLLGFQPAVVIYPQPPYDPGQIRADDDDIPAGARGRV